MSIAVGGTIMMRRAAAVCLLFTTLEACAPEATTVVRGELSWHTREFPTLAECETGRVLRLGVMASVPYDILKRRYKEVSAGGKSPVVAEVEGVIQGANRSANELTIKHPRLLDAVAGTCEEGLPESEGRP